MLTPISPDNSKLGASVIDISGIMLAILINTDPGNIDDIKVIIKGREPFNIHKCGPIPKQCDYKPKKEVKDNRHEPKPSRLLNITRNEHKQSIEKTASAINFSEYAYGKEDKDNV